MKTVTTLQDRLNEYEHRLPSINEAHRKSEEAGIEENDYTVYAVEDLEFDLGLVKSTVAKKKAFIENQVN